MSLIITNEYLGEVYQTVSNPYSIEGSIDEFVTIIDVNRTYQGYPYYKNQLEKNIIIGSV